ncbi:MAG: methyltransferase domain-containing protein [Rhodocyclales bacterium]|nr:methyltransferase domain-containing protein [Rhodocyclales bacterium]
MGDFLIPAPERVKQFAEHVVFGTRVLDVGTGSGILAKLAYERGVRDVTAIDINPAAVAHARNLLPHVTVLHGDLFENVSGVFDTILFAAPWSEGVIRTMFDHALYDCGVVERFFKNVRPYLATKGRIWLQYCDAFPENFSRLPQWISANGFQVECSWSYMAWGQLARRQVSVILYEIR